MHQRIRQKDQQDGQISLIIYFTHIILDMHRTSKYLSSGGNLYKQLTVFHHASYEESSR
jgi:hypothetical protein